MPRPYPSSEKLRKDRALSEITNNAYLKAAALENLGLTDASAVSGTNVSPKVAVLALTGAAIHAGTSAWTNPESGSINITRVILDITTASTGASTIDVGYTATSAATSSDTFLDGVSGTPAAIFDSSNAALDAGANIGIQKAATGKWVTVNDTTGDATGLVGNLYIHYNKL